MRAPTHSRNSILASGRNFCPIRPKGTIRTRRSHFGARSSPREALKRPNLGRPRLRRRPPFFPSHARVRLYSAAPVYRETEIKLRVDDLVVLIRKLNRLGARTKGRVLERNTLFDTPDADFRRRGRLLRLRVETPAGSAMIAAGRAGAILTSKQPAPASAEAGYKQNLESEIAITVPDRWLRKMRALGLRPAFRYEKFRTGFRLGRLHLDLDETPVGTFLELEGEPRRIDGAAHALGYSRRDYIRATYGDLYAADCLRRGKIPRAMLFGA